MRFYSLTSRRDEALLEADYRRARRIGPVAAGEEILFFRRGLRLCYVPYADIRRCFRRVSEVPAKLGCCSGSYDTESLVLYTDEGELAEIALPDTRAARALIAELKEKMPQVIFACPPRPDGR